MSFSDKVFNGRVKDAVVFFQAWCICEKRAK